MRGKWLGGTMFGTMDVCLCGCSLQFWLWWGEVYSYIGTL